ncbi:hypothetical protein ABZX12_14830 [Kribbella sp. NPDC003505]|uniref:hypothetical protein n=1 Tax=Kribbella sp. NPDC003505 TaxID=3154448 RepID=UPI0033BB399D
MTSRGIGDVRRVLGQPKSWIDQTFAKPAPPLPDVRGDALLGFVCDRVRQWESQVENEAAEYHDRPLGPAMVRYALDIRRLCTALRLVLAQYGEMRDADPGASRVIRRTVQELSTAWRNHPDWRDEWVS